jgi:HEAT repeat protein
MRFFFPSSGSFYLTGDGSILLSDIGHARRPAKKESVPALMRWLSHRHKHFRHIATRTLGLIGTTEAIEALRKGVDDRRHEVGGAVAAAIKAVQ